MIEGTGRRAGDPWIGVPTFSCPNAFVFPVPPNVGVHKGEAPRFQRSVELVTLTHDE